MLTDDARFDQFLAWLQAVDPSFLPNEAEVESKFVVPLFQYLDYPEQCRRPQYPLDTYEPGIGKRGRKPTIDQIYFSTTKQSEQTSDTSSLRFRKNGEVTFVLHTLLSLLACVTNTLSVR